MSGEEERWARHVATKAALVLTTETPVPAPCGDGCDFDEVCPYYIDCAFESGPPFDDEG